MLRDALYLAYRDLRYLLPRRETLLWTFVMPIIFFYFIGNVTGGFGSSRKARSHRGAGSIRRRLSRG